MEDCWELPDGLQGLAEELSMIAHRRLFCSRNITVMTTGGAQSGALPADSVEFPPDLQLVIEAWETLPEATRAGILAMVRAAK